LSTRGEPVRKTIAVLFLICGVAAMVRGFTQFLGGGGTVVQFVLLEVTAILLVVGAGWLWELDGDGGDQ
jgi:hypothetical protein